MATGGGVPSISTLVDLSAGLIGLCLDYSRKVKNAKEDVDRLYREIQELYATSQRLSQLLGSRDGAGLPATRDLSHVIEESNSKLRELEQQLRPSTTRKLMSRCGVRALKWPFQSGEIDNIIQKLARNRETILAAMQIDQIAIVLSIDEKIALGSLPFVGNASFDSHAEEYNPRCLPDTRVELRKQISEWIMDPHSKRIFWLSGMAGTGKSTISRTIAQERREAGDLGASFFFRRGEVDRTGLTKFMPTLARQLANSVPGLASYIKAAVDSDATIWENHITRQFDKLILEPLSKISPSKQGQSSLVIVIDALDECERDVERRW